MNISAVNCTPIKPQVAFKNVNVDYQKLHQIATDLDNQTVDSKDIKKPLAVAASVGAAVGLAYVSGAKAAKGVSALYDIATDFVKKMSEKSSGEVKDAASKLADETKEAVKKAKLGELFETGLKKASAFMSDKIAKLRTVAPEDITVLSKKDMIKNALANVLEKGLNFAKNIYKKIAYSTIPSDVVGADKAQKAFENVAGAVGVATIVPEIISRDADGDGVKDIMQKSQNAYTSKAEQSGEFEKNIGFISEILQTLS